MTPAAVSTRAALNELRNGPPLSEENLYIRIMEATKLGIGELIVVFYEKGKYDQVSESKKEQELVRDFCHKEHFECEFYCSPTIHTAKIKWFDFYNNEDREG